MAKKMVVKFISSMGGKFALLYLQANIPIYIARSRDWTEYPPFL